VRRAWAVLLVLLPRRASAQTLEEPHFSGRSFVVSTSFALLRTETSVRWGFEVLVQIPFDRFLYPQPNKETLMKNRHGWAVALPSAIAIAGVARADAPIAKPTPIVVEALPPNALRALVAAAWKASGVDRDEALGDLASRARASALAPEVRLRAYRGIDVGARVYRVDEGDRATLTDGTQTFFEARMSWRLDRLVFADEEVALERIRLERAELKQRISAKVLDLVLRHQRAKRAANNPDLLPAERDEAAVSAVETLLALDAITGGAATPILLRPTP
jgi:hypothetical protein